MRPPLQREIVNGVTKNCVAVSPNNQIFVSLQDQPVVLSADGQIPDGVAAYGFDRCFDATATQAEVYEKAVRPSV